MRCLSGSEIWKNFRIIFCWKLNINRRLKSSSLMSPRNYQKSPKDQNLQFLAWFLFLLSQKSNLFWIVRLSTLRWLTSVFKRFISSSKAWFEARSKAKMNHVRHSHKNLPQTGSIDSQGYILLSFWISSGDISLLIAIPFPVILFVMIGFVKWPRKVPS